LLILGIETSCDETAAAVVRDGASVLSSVVVSQIEDHAQFGGVVPEIASRKHSEAISMVVQAAVNKAGITFGDLEACAVTRGPGLIGSLLVGVSAAKGIALALDIPICGVNHVHGHLFSAFLEHPDLQFPFVGLVVSGGHTSLYYVKDPLRVELVGKTRDDAAGEAFDKVAKLLGLGYPGGPVIERRARLANGHTEPFPRALMDKTTLDFSFSGLKTAVLRRVEKLCGVCQNRNVHGSFHQLIPNTESNESAALVNSLAHGFQEAIIDVLTTKLFWAAERYHVDHVVVCGGVACNDALRQRVQDQGQAQGVRTIFPSPVLCTDNAAMIASRADTLLAALGGDDLGFSAKSRW
jgi:N6-L-threonylcarbamoyladenine synthase